MTLRAGFIGRGKIGKPMARRLVAAGFLTTLPAAAVASQIMARV
jgi:3-hydroxyisobutyrate dehydrogenase-like beta-hydroxyacid dehydrogenase